MEKTKLLESWEKWKAILSDSDSSDELVKQVLAEIQSGVSETSEALKLTQDLYNIVNACGNKDTFSEADQAIVSKARDVLGWAETILEISKNLHDLSSQEDFKGSVQTPERRREFMDKVIEETEKAFNIGTEIGKSFGPAGDMATLPVQVGNIMLKQMNYLNEQIYQRNQNMQAGMDVLDEMCSASQSLATWDMDMLIDMYDNFSALGIKTQAEKDMLKEIEKRIEIMKKTSKELADSYQNELDKIQEENDGIVKNKKINTDDIVDIIMESEKYKGDPLVLDMGGDGFTTTSLEDGVYFDLDNNGMAERINWIGENEALLALDKDGDGIIENGNEVFGDNTILKNGKKAKNGFEALKEYDSNSDGKIDKKDNIFNQLLLWTDRNGNGYTEQGEKQTLSEAGISEIKLDYREMHQEISNDVFLENKAEFVLENGEVKEIGELWVGSNLHDTSDEYSEVELSELIKSLPNVRSIGNVYSMHKAMAMDDSGKLVLLMQKMLGEESEETKFGYIEQMLGIMCHTENIKAGSRGPYFDAKQLAIIECLMGRSYRNDGSNPNSPGAKELKKAYQEYLNLYYCEIVGQSTLKNYKDVIRIKTNADGSKSINMEQFMDYFRIALIGEDNPRQIQRDMVRYIKYLEAMGIQGFDELSTCYEVTSCQVLILRNHSFSFISYFSNAWSIWIEPQI